MSSRRLVFLVATGLLLGLVVIPGIAIAGHQFSDVPDSNIFHDDIAWLADNGITKGCNPPANTEFCPDDEVRRETMAAFMHRLAVNQVVDAGTLQGLTASELAGAASVGRTFASCGDRMVLTNGKVTEIGKLEVSVPDTGVINMTSQISLDAPLGESGSLVQLWQTIDSPCETNKGVTAQGYSDLANSVTDIATFTTAIRVGSGDHVIRTCANAHQLVVTETTNVVDSHMSVVWTPLEIDLGGGSAAGVADHDVEQLAADVRARVDAMREALPGADG